MTTEVNVLFFASARQAAGVSSIQVQLDSDPANTTQLRRLLAERFPALAAMVQDTESITLAVNEKYVEGEVELKSGDTVALIPPISGG